MLSDDRFGTQVGTIAEQQSPCCASWCIAVGAVSRFRSPYGAASKCRSPMANWRNKTTDDEGEARERHLALRAVLVAGGFSVNPSLLRALS